MSRPHDRHESAKPQYFRRTIHMAKTTKTKEGAEEKVVKKTKAQIEADQLNDLKKDTQMGKLFADIQTPPSVGDVVEGTVIGSDKAAVYVDLPPFGTGIIYGREYINARDIIKKINPGDAIAGKVVSVDNDQGYIEISLKEARQAIIWSEAEEAIKNKNVYELPVQDANKGGLIIAWQGITGFLPASQLNTSHYPRVTDGDKDRILEELKKLIGEKITVSIIGAVPKEGKLIFSEKNPELKNKEKIIDKYEVGDAVEGEITGIVDFGLFIKLEEGLEGLVHISEIDWGLVDNIKAMFKVGEKVRAKVIEIKEGKISLSIKALRPNPWLEAEKKFKKDETVQAVVIKFNKHGALASIEEGVAGLVHISEFGNETKMREKLSLGKSYAFKISLFEPKDQRMTLTFIDKEKAA